MTLYLMHVLQLNTTVPVTGLQQAAAVDAQQSLTNPACIVCVAYQVIKPQIDFYENITAYRHHCV